MNTKKIIATLASILSVAAFATDETAASPSPETPPPSGWNWAMGEGISYGETSVVSTELSLAFDSKYLSYGFVDNDDPILTPSATATFFDWCYLGVSAIFDLTTYGRDAGYGQHNGRSRGGRYTELDPSVGFAHGFSSEDYEWLPTTVEFDLGYMYEYHSRSYNEPGDDTQFVTFEVSLPDLWIEPTFLYERDIDRDNGTYLNLELGHTFGLCEGVSLRPSVAQGFGNRQRMKGYLPNLNSWDDQLEEYTQALSHAGLMDTLVKTELSWEIASGVTLAGYVGYSDFLFDRKIREAAREYEASGDWTDSWNFVGGLSLSVAF